jgi:hypothetical protein
MHPEHSSIGELAYRLWQARGCPDGTAEQDWLEAEKQLQASRLTRSRSSEALDDSLKSTFPASDPPASRLPDVPPANAAAKWKAAEASHVEPSRVEPSRAEPSRKNPPRRRPQGESKPTNLSKPRNDRPS